MFVSIHIRRANYKDHLALTEGGRLVQLDFFRRAIRTMENDMLKLTEEKKNEVKEIDSIW